MKTTNFLLSVFLIKVLIFIGIDGAFYFPPPECVKDSRGYYDLNMLVPFSEDIICRAGQIMKILGAHTSNMDKRLCCCKWDDEFTPAQTSGIERKFYANSCEFKNGSSVPIRESLLTSGNDLYCFNSEKMQTFKAEINGVVRDMSCCMKKLKPEKNSSQIEPVEQNEAENNLKSKIVKKIKRKIIKIRKMKKNVTSTDGPEIAISASDAVPVVEIESTESLDDVTVDQQNSQEIEEIENQSEEQQQSTQADLKLFNIEQQEVTVNSKLQPDQSVIISTEQKINQDKKLSNAFVPDKTTPDANDDDVQKMTTAISHVKLRVQAATNDLPEFLAASECVYASEKSTQPVTGYMSYDDPDITLGCRSQQKMINMTTVNKDDGNTYNVYCCKFDPSLKPINPAPFILANECEYDEDGELYSYSGLKPGPDLKCKANTHELVTVNTHDIIKHTAVTLSCCKQKVETTTTASPTTTTRTPILTLNLAGSECSYLSDGTLKKTYMDYCEDKPVCRQKQVMKKIIYNFYQRCCCQDVPTLTPTKANIILRAPDCAYKNGQELARWSVIRSGNDLTCNIGYKIKETIIFENGVKSAMSCCVIDDGKDKTTTTTVRPTLSGTTPMPQDLPFAGVQCNYDEDQSLKTSYMETCTPNMMCRSKEVKLEVYILMPDKTKVKKCCCDYRKELTGNSTAGPTIIAPKCHFDHDGYINPWSVIETGNDLGCVISDNLMTFDLENDNSKMSCCVKKSTILISTTMRPTPMPFTTPISSTTSMITSSSSTTTSTTAAPDKTTTNTVKTESTTTKSSAAPENNSTKIVALECVYLKNGSLNVDYMDFYSSKYVCRSQYVMKNASVYRDPGFLLRKICCDYTPSIPFDSSLPPVIASTCYFAPKTKELLRWSLSKTGPDLVCESSQFYMYNISVLTDGIEVSYSCCQPVNKAIPTVKPSTTTTTRSPIKDGIGNIDPEVHVTTTISSTTTPAPKNQIYQAAPLCKYKEDKTLYKDYMEQCSAILTCRSQEAMIEQKMITVNESSTALCCCDSRPELAPVQLNISINAPKCHFDTNGYIVIYSVILFGPELKCDENDELKNYTMEMSSGSQIMSCCLQKGAVTKPTTARPYETTAASTTYLPSTFTEVPTDTHSSTTVKPWTTSTTLPSIIIETLKSTTQPTTVTTPPITSTTSRYSPPSTTISPSTTTKSGKPHDYPISVPTEGISSMGPPISISTVTPIVISPTTPYDSKTTITTPIPTTANIKKRTVPPKDVSHVPRIVKPGECPDCLLPKIGPINSLQMAIKHLQMPGPIMGKCPTKTHTMRIILPKPEFGLNEGRCCCESDLHPLPYSFD